MKRTIMIITIIAMMFCAGCQKEEHHPFYDAIKEETRYIADIPQREIPQFDYSEQGMFEKIHNILFAKSELKRIS